MNYVNSKIWQHILRYIYWSVYQLFDQPLQCHRQISEDSIELWCLITGHSNTVKNVINRHYRQRATSECFMSILLLGSVVVYLVFFAKWAWNIYTNLKKGEKSLRISESTVRVSIKFRINSVKWNLESEFNFVSLWSNISRNLHASYPFLQHLFTHLVTHFLAFSTITARLKSFEICATYWLIKNYRRFEGYYCLFV
jgi:hypothetical protein